MRLFIERPNRKQEEFFRAATRYVAYGGARGGGKSWAVRRKAELLAFSYPGIRLLIVRRSLPELRENHVLPMCAELGEAAAYRAGESGIVFQNGSRIKLGYCDAESDVLRYQGQEFDVIFIDEATQLTESQYTHLKYCLRGVNDFPKRLYLTCNPGGVGHAWVKRLFLDRDYRNGERPEDYTFIPARASDNEALLKKDPDYVRMLDELPDGLREAWRDGNWDIFSGQFFTEFERGIHVVAPFEIPAHWRRYVSLDYGLDMCACLWIAEDEGGRSYVYRELYRPNLIVSEAARRIRELSAGEDIYEYLAPPDLWNRQRETGRTIADIFASCGVVLTRTGNARIDGWMAVKEELKIIRGEDGRETAALRIFPECGNLIRCLALLRHDENRPNDVAREPHELTHAPDALRGYCAHLRARAEPPRQERKPFFAFERARQSPCGYGDRVSVI